jgi:hypothetical protein
MRLRSSRIGCHANRKLVPGQKSASGKFGASSPRGWQGGDEGELSAAAASFSPSILGNDSVLYHSLPGLQARNRFVGRLPKMVTIRPSEWPLRNAPIGIPRPCVYRCLCGETSYKLTSGGSARFHLSDYRLVARHNFRVARHPGSNRKVPEEWLVNTLKRLVVH